MVVQFRLLGEVRADVGGRLLQLGPARQRCVLVALLVDANRMVSTDRLIDRVWGQQTPRQTRNSVYSYMSRLRRALAISDEVRIARQATGYQLTVDPLTVDLHQFQHLTRRARTADPPSTALALLEQALQLWRDAAFADLDTPWLATVREDLHRRRFAAELDRNDLALSQGQHTELLAELTNAVTAAPFDERLTGQFMLALYLCGRQADALAHYHQLRQRLADELGTNPSPPLRRLHQQILTTDPTLAILTRRSEQLAIPHQLRRPAAPIR